ncbi:hypothetical protein [Nocardia sp. NPDC052112]
MVPAEQSWSSTYRAAPAVASGATFVADVEADKTFQVMFDPADLLDI